VDLIMDVEIVIMDKCMEINAHVDVNAAAYLNAKKRNAKKRNANVKE